jgi:hypothetical protein
LRKIKEKIKGVAKNIVRSAINEHPISKKIMDLENSIESVQSGVSELKKPLNKLSPNDLGYYSGVFGPPIDSEKMINCRLFGNRDDALKFMPKNAICAEVGVAYGKFSQKILDVMEPRKLHLIDLYSTKPGDPEFWGMDLFLKANLNHEEYIKEKFKNEIIDNKVEMVKGYSHDALESFDDDYFDYVYLDGGHDYNCVKKDIEILCRKVKSGGIITFNDYTYFTLYENFEYGVSRAVNELLSESKHEVMYYCLSPNKMDDIIIKINK